MSCADAFETATPLNLAIDPATVRQKSGQETMKVMATVTLKTPSPGFFICKLRSEEAAKIAFPDIVFRKGDTTDTSKGLVHWKAVPREVRVRVTAFNTDAPDQQLSFTVVLIPTLEPAPAEGAPRPPTP